MKHVLKFVFATAVIALAACKGGGETLPDTGSSNAGVSENPTFSGNNSGSNITATPEQRRIEDILRNNLVVYFDYDQADIRAEFNEMLQVHGRNLSQNPNMRVRLEGHADERGSREYNIGLGERRAQAVRRILMLQGATAQQLSTVSYGEERPAQTGSDEEAWRLNRRVELVYQ